MKCCVDGCNNEAKQRYGGDNNFYCGKHLHHMYRHGKIIEHHRRTPNEYLIDEENNIAFIIVYDNKGEFKDKVMIDIDDLEKVLEHKWHINTNGYCRCHDLLIDLQRFLLNLNEFNKNYVDHISGNKLDNRKCNLRIVTNQQNQFNRNNDGSGGNKRKGVSYRKDRNKWRAYITIDGKQISLGLFETEQEAIDARRKAEEKYYGEYRRKEEE